MNQRLISGTVRVVAFSAAMLLLTMLVVTRSQAAFTATTSNPTSGFTAAELSLRDDDNNTAMFNATGMVPGSSVTECIAITYDGDRTPSPVRLYGTGTGPLAPFLELTIEVGTGGSSASCAGFSSATTIFTGTLQSFAGARTNWANGLNAFSAASTPFTRTIRVTAEVQDDDAAQGLSANASFTWETRSS